MKIRKFWGALPCIICGLGHLLHIRKNLELLCLCFGEWGLRADHNHNDLERVWISQVFWFVCVRMMGEAGEPGQERGLKDGSSGN